MKVLVVSPELPYERVPHAGGQHLLRHLAAVASAHQVELWVPADPRFAPHLGEVPAWVPLRSAPFDRARRRGVRDVRWWLRRQARFRALKVTAILGLQAAGIVDAARAADVVELHWTDTAVLVPWLRRAGVTTPLVVVAHDVTATVVPATARLGASRWRTTLRRPLEHLRARTEARDLQAADLVCVFKPEDEQALRALGVRTEVAVVEPALEPPAPPSQREPGRVLFTGAMWRPENEHGVAWFLREVWPEVVRRHPAARFVVAGADPSPRLRALAASYPGVTVTGTVPDLAPHYAAASVFVAPLHAPGGIKFKVPQAMLGGLPVVATSVAVTGLRAPAGTLWAVCDEPARMAGAIADALDRPDDAEAVGRAAAAWVRDRYAFERSVGRTMAIYERLAAGSGRTGPSA